jgi:hypothetical protein
MNSTETIILTGVAHRQRPIRANAGDVCVYRQDSAQGGSNRGGRHTNYGYSGFFKASIFDGTKWRNLKLDTMIQRESLAYDFQYDAENVARMVLQVIAQRQGARVRYNAERKGFIF